jgi:hypothetical protein
MPYRVGTEQTMVIEDRRELGDSSRSGQRQKIPIGVQQGVDVDSGEALCGFPHERLTVFDGEWDRVSVHHCPDCRTDLESLTLAALPWAPRRPTGAAAGHRIQENAGTVEREDAGRWQNPSWESYITPRNLSITSRTTTVRFWRVAMTAFPQICPGSPKAISMIGRGVVA